MKDDTALIPKDQLQGTDFALRVICEGIVEMRQRCVSPSDVAEALLASATTMGREAWDVTGLSQQFYWHWVGILRELAMSPGIPTGTKQAYFEWLENIPLPPKLDGIKH